MDIKSIITILKDANMISSEEDMSLFSDSFNKFGISILLLHDEDKFRGIVDLLKENQIPLQKQNGIYALRIFAVGEEEISSIIESFKDIQELDFLRMHPEMIAEPKNIKLVLDNMKKWQDDKAAYKDGSQYYLDLLLVSEKVNNPLDMCLMKYLNNPSLIDKLENHEGNNEEDVDVALELQKAENLICEEYLLPIDDGWKVVIHKKEVNSFQQAKDTIALINELNLSLDYHDALLLVLFYKSKLDPQEIEEIINNDLFKEEN